MSRPTLRERMKPLELVGFAAVLAAFTGVVTLVAARDLRGAVILAGVAFIVALLVLAMLALAAGGPDRMPDGRPVLDRHDGEPGDAGPGAGAAGDAAPPAAGPPPGTGEDEPR